MTDYISRDAAIESFRKNLDGGYVLTNDAQTTHILQSLPAADVRPVVLCKDCKHRFMKPNGWHCPYAEWGIEDDDFCSYGVDIKEES